MAGLILYLLDRKMLSEFLLCKVCVVFPALMSPRGLWKMMSSGLSLIIRDQNLHFIRYWMINTHMKSFKATPSGLGKTSLFSRNNTQSFHQSIHYVPFTDVTSRPVSCNSLWTFWSHHFFSSTLLSLKYFLE